MRQHRRERVSRPPHETEDVTARRCRRGQRTISSPSVVDCDTLPGVPCSARGKTGARSSGTASYRGSLARGRRLLYKPQVDPMPDGIFPTEPPAVPTTRLVSEPRGFRYGYTHNWDGRRSFLFPSTLLGFKPRHSGSWSCPKPGQGS